MSNFLAIALLAVGAAENPSRLADIGPAADFALVTEEGKPLRFSELRGRVVLVSFIFTTCNGTCPATTHRMAQVQQELRSRGLLAGARVRLLSVTLDPARDTPEVLKGYAGLYDVDTATWSFLTGPPADVSRAFDAWGMWAKPSANGQLDHPSRVYLVDGRGRVREIYSLAFLKPAWVADDVALLLGERH